MNIFVTGATGFLGYHFVNLAVAKGYKVICLKRSLSRSLFSPDVEGKITWVKSDEKLKNVVKDFNPDVLFHAAWGGVRGEDRDNANIQNDNIEMSRKIFTLHPYKQIISIGSQAEYGYYSGRIAEDYPLNPISEYAKAKTQCCEEMKRHCIAHNIEWQWIRIFTVFGEKQTGGLIKIAAEKCLRNEKELLTTKGEQRYSYLYSSDFADAMCKILGSKGKSGIYNLSQPRGIYSNKEILDKVKLLTKSDINYSFGAIPYPEGQVMLMDGNVDKFENAFGTIPYTDFDEALTMTINSFR